MLARKWDKTVVINPLTVERYMADFWLILDDEGNVLEDPLTYAQEELKPHTVDIPIVSREEINKTKADIDFIAMMTDINLD